MVVAAMQAPDQHIRGSLGFRILPKDTSTCRPGESNQRSSNNKTALFLSHSHPTSFQDVKKKKSPCRLYREQDIRNLQNLRSNSFMHACLVMRINCHKCWQNHGYILLWFNFQRWCFGWPGSGDKETGNCPRIFCFHHHKHGWKTSRLAISSKVSGFIATKTDSLGEKKKQNKKQLFGAYKCGNAVWNSGVWHGSGLAQL